jgi:hypothetical protein
MTDEKDYEPSPDMVEELAEALMTLCGVQPAPIDPQSIWAKATHPQHPTVQ